MTKLVHELNDQIEQLAFDIKEALAWVELARGERFRDDADVSMEIARDVLDRAAHRLQWTIEPMIRRRPKRGERHG